MRAGEDHLRQCLIYVLFLLRNSFHNIYSQEFDNFDCAVDLWNATRAEPPAMYLVFLWSFWTRVIQYEDRSKPCGFKPSSYGPYHQYYCGRDVREWLQWLRLLASHPSSRRILSLATLKPMEAWLFKWYYGYYSSGVRYSSWVRLIPYQHRASVVCVSHFDWAHAKSILVRDQPTMDGEVPESLSASADIPALIGALYLSFLALNASGFRVENVSDICSFTRIACFEGLDMDDHLKATPMPAMVQFRNTLHRANPACCKMLGPKTVDLYSSSIVLLGVADRVDHLIWKCNRCVSCIATRFRKSATPELPPDTNKHQTVDAAIRDQVSTFPFFNHLCSYSISGRGCC